MISLVGRNYEEVLLWEPDFVPVDWRVIVDLVDTNHRAEKIAFVMNNGDRVAVILSVGMFKEGADWVQASRVIDLVPTGSDQDRNQRFGRIIRDAPGKKHVSYFSFFPYPAHETRKEQQKRLSLLYAHFHATLVLENAINPIKMPVERPASREIVHGSCGRELDLLGQFDGPKQEAIIRDSYEEMIALAAQKEDLGEGVCPDEAKGVIMGVLESHGVKNDLEKLAKQIILLMRRRQNILLPTADLLNAGFDRVWSSDCLEGVILFSGGVGGPTTFRGIRQAIETVFEQRWHDNFSRIQSLREPPDSQSSAYWWCTHNKVLHRQGKLSE